jgi:hypothetical protein
METPDAFHMRPPKWKNVDYNYPTGPRPDRPINVIVVECDGLLCGLDMLCQHPRLTPAMNSNQ